jgi:predicted short-subunit dehydrogenase-like oxidoreductase (DUF2520 family)
MALTAGIIGTGKLGKALAIAFAELNMLKFVVTGSSVHSTEITELLSSDIRIYNDLSSIKIFPDILFLTVQDYKIQQLATDLKNLYNEKLSKTIIIHCSGFLDVNILYMLKPCTRSVAKLHPFQTFFNADDEVFDNVAWTATCDDATKPSIEEIVKLLNGTLYFTDELQNFDSEKYHISAVFAANYQSVNLRYATRTAIQSGIDPTKFIPKIALTSTNNSIPKHQNNGNELALTGPIARGDFEAVKRHIESLRNSETELKGYVLIGFATAELAFAEGLIDFDSYTNFKNIFLFEIKNLFSF